MRCLATPLIGSLLLVCSSSGCDVVESTVKLSYGGPPGSCTATVAGAQRPMNSYMVEVYSVTAADPMPGPLGVCSACVIDGIGCSLLDRSCVCGADRPTALHELGEALSGTRVEVDAAEQYCVRVLALELEDPAERSACSCPLSLVVEPAPVVETRVRACALNEQPARAAETLELPMYCLDDQPVVSLCFDHEPPGPQPPVEPPPADPPPPPAG